MTTIVASTGDLVNRSILNYINNQEFPELQIQLAQDLKDECTKLGYEVLEMGSYTKHTEILGSDIDLLVILRDDQKITEADQILFDMQKEIRNSANVKIGDHS